MIPPRTALELLPKFLFGSSGQGSRPSGTDDIRWINGSETHAEDNLFSESAKPSVESKPLPLRTQRLFLILALGATIALYLPHLATTFVDWDLVAYRDILYTNDYLKTMVRLVTDFQGKVVTGYYAPLASVSLMLDKWFIGSAVPSAWFTLFVNVLLHCLNGVLVFSLLRKLGAAPSAAWLAAAVFLIHPVQVSSVLWFCQRKGLLAAAFYLAAYLAYLVSAHREGDTAARGTCWYALALGLFGLALLTKPTVAVFPLALLVWRLLFSCPANTAQLGTGETAVAGECNPSVNGHVADVGSKLCEKTTREPIKRFCRWVRSPRPSEALPLKTASILARHVWALMPFFLVALGSGLIAMESERVSMEVQAAPDLPLIDRPMVAAAAVWFYIGKVLLPVYLAPIYHRWDVDVSRAVWWLPVVGLVAAAALIFRYCRAIGRLPIWCMLNFLIPLLPAVGLLKFGYLRLSYVADHFVYLSMVGMAGLIALSITGLRGWVGSRARHWVTAAGCVFLTFCGMQTFLYGKAWQDSVSLWTYNLKHDPESWTAHNYLGHALVSAGRPREAGEHFKRTLELKQKYVADHIERSRELERFGDTTRAGRERIRAENVHGSLAVAYHNLGNAFLFSEMHHQAIEQYKKALEVEPTMVKALTNLGVSSIALGDIPQAVRCLTRAVELSPGNFEALYNLGLALRFSGDRAGADRAFQRARVVRPDVPTPRFPEDGDGKSPPQ